MAVVRTNSTQLSVTVESAVGTAGTVWEVLEPNDGPTIGAQITTVARDPITDDRQRRKGTLTDLDSPVEISQDVTMSFLRKFLEAYLYSTGVNTDVTNVAVTAAANATGYTVAALTAAQANKFEVSTLIWANGFSTAANNGLKTVDADIATSATAITISETITDEASPPTAARLSFAGHRVVSGDTPTWAWDGVNKQGTLSFTGATAELQALGLTVGQFVHFGSITALGGTIQNGMQNASANDMFGFARVRSFATADTVIFDKTAAALQFDSPTIGDLDLLFGQFIRNVAVADSDFLTRTFQFEETYPDLFGVGAPGYEYAIGNHANNLSMEFPLTDKSTATASFVGTDAEPPVAAGSRKTGAASATAPFDTAAFNTTPDIARLRITDVDEEGLTTDFKSLTVTINNNAAPEKCIGLLGARSVNFGNIEVGLEAQILFTDADVITRIRNNTTVTGEVITKNDDGVLAMDFPSLDLSDGAREFPRDETVRVNLTAGSFRDPLFNTSIGVSLLPVPIP